MYKKPKVIAEIGCNHTGDIKIAFELIDLAKDSGADVVKFQKRHSRELLSQEQYDSPHPSPYNSYGKTYGEHRESLELKPEWFPILKDACSKYNVKFMSTPFDEQAVDELVDLGVKRLKIAVLPQLGFPRIATL